MNRMEHPENNKNLVETLRRQKIDHYPGKATAIVKADACTQHPIPNGTEGGKKNQTIINI